MSIILASASPRRKELMKYICHDFIIVPADIDETIPDDIIPKKAAEYLSLKKALRVSSEYPNDTVIGCDTTVIIDNEILGKPSCSNDCFRMLKKLSGRTHKVVTGVTICSFSCNSHVSFSETTEVNFYLLTDNEILTYISTGEPFDKAGGYGIQGFGCMLVKKINGDYNNVVGLPVSKLKRILERI